MQLSLIQPEVHDPALVNETFVAIDFGDSGGFVWNCLGNLFAQEMPGSLQARSDLLLGLTSYNPRVIGEEIHTYGQEGRRSLETFIRGIGQIEGVCCALGIRLCTVLPKKWQKFYGFPSSKEFKNQYRWKQFLVKEAKKRWPLLATKGTADALLIWNYFVANRDKIKPRLAKLVL